MKSAFGPVVYLAVICVVGFPGEGRAQGGPPSERSPSRQEMLQNIQGQYQERLARELRLTPEQQEFFVEVLTSFGEERAQLFPRRVRIMGEVRALLTGPPSEERAIALMRELREVREEEARLLLEEEERLLEMLSPTQVLRFQVLRDQFGDRIRVLRAGDSGGPFGPRGGGPGAFGNPRR